MAEFGISFWTREPYVKMSLDEYHKLVGKAEKCEKSGDKPKTGPRYGCLMVQ